MDIRLSFLIINSVLLSSCHPLYCDWDSGYEQLKEISSADIIAGTYELNSKSIDYLASEGYAGTCKLIILESGTFNLINGPDSMFDSFGRNSGRSLNKKGKWSTSCGDSYGCMFELMGVLVVPLSRKFDGTLAIPIPIGDGDDCRGIVFERKE